MADHTNAEVSDERLTFDHQQQADNYLEALLGYSGGFYGAAIKAGLPAAETVGPIAHIERAARELHRLALNRRSVTSQASEGSGWKLVPVEKLTPEMRAAAETAARKINPGRSEDHIKSVALDGLSIYRAIVASAPSQPAAVGVTDEMVEITWADIRENFGSTDLSIFDLLAAVNDILAARRAALVHRD